MIELNFKTNFDDSHLVRLLVLEVVDVVGDGAGGGEGGVAGSVQQGLVGPGDALPLIAGYCIMSYSCTF